MEIVWNINVMKETAEKKYEIVRCGDYMCVVFVHASSLDEAVKICHEVEEVVNGERVES